MKHKASAPKTGALLLVKNEAPLMIKRRADVMSAKEHATDVRSVAVVGKYEITGWQRKKSCKEAADAHASASGKRPESSVFRNTSPNSFSV